MTRRLACRASIISLLMVLSGSPLSAQVRGQPVVPAVTDSAAAHSGEWGALRIAKWSLAGIAAGTAIYGFVHNQRADERYEALEELCVQDPVRCDDVLPNGAYADAELEAEYQAVRDMDARARTALIAGQVGVAASVLLFILDLRNGESPENIPYEPRTIDIDRSRDGGLSLRVQLPVR